MFDFEALSQAIPRQTVLCVGDLMLDEFVYGEVSRVSPEAPAPVIAVQRSETNIGGAGNVARNSFIDSAKIVTRSTGATMTSSRRLKIRIRRTRSRIRAPAS